MKDDPVITVALSRYQILELILASGKPDANSTLKNAREALRRAVREPKELYKVIHER